MMPSTISQPVFPYVGSTDLPDARLRFFISLFSDTKVREELCSFGLSIPTVLSSQNIVTLHNFAEHLYSTLPDAAIPHAHESIVRRGGDLFSQQFVSFLQYTKNYWLVSCFSPGTTDLRFEALCETAQRVRQTLPAATFKRLDLSNRGLPFIPMELFQSRQIRVLDLSHNKLFFVQKEISCLHNLRELSLFDNNLCALPQEIGKLRNLKILNIWETGFTKLTPDLFMLRKLEHFFTLLNEITKISHTIAISPRLSVLAYTLKMLWQSTFP